MQHFFSFIYNIVTSIWYSFDRKLSLAFILSLSVSLGFTQNFSSAINVGGADDDVTNSLVVDANGNSYIIGSFQATVDFDPSTTGTTELTSLGGSDIFFAKYDKSGALIWVRHLGSALRENGRSIALDNSGNVYITGNFRATGATANTIDFDPGSGTANLTTSNTSGNAFLAKYDTNGNYQWAFNLGTASSSVDGYRLLLDQNSNIILVGFANGTSDFDPNTTNTANLTASNENFLAQYDSDGNYKWALALGFGELESDEKQLGLDNDGNIYVTGGFSGTIDFDPGTSTNNLTSNGSSDIFISKYNNSGVYQWAKSFGGTGSDEGSTITANSANEIIVVGIFSGTDVDFDPGTGTANLSSSGSLDVFLAKYSSDGTYQWAKSFGGTSADRASAVQLNSKNEILIGGSFSSTDADFDPGTGTVTLSSAGDTDGYVTRFDNDGNYLSAFKVGSTSEDRIIDAYYNELGTVVIAGFFFGTIDLDPGSGTSNVTSNGNGDFFIARYGLPEINVKVTSNLASGSTYDFVNDIKVGSSSSNVNFTIENLGAAALTLSGTAGSLVALSGTDASDFTVTQTSVTSSIAGESNVTFTVSFSPSSAGAKSATLTIMSDDADESTYTINLTGKGVTPEINLKAAGNDVASGGNYDFGSVQSGQSSSDVTFTIENTGDGELALTGTAGSLVVLSGTNAADFTVTQTNVTSPVAAGGNVTFTVKYTASTSAIGAASAVLTITSDDADESTYTINLAGSSTSSVTGLPANLISGSLKVGPVPAHDHLNVTINGAISPKVQYQIIDLQGRLVSKGSATTQNGKVSLNVKSLQDGTYLFVVQTAQGTVVRRIQKQ